MEAITPHEGGTRSESEPDVDSGNHGANAELLEGPDFLLLQTRVLDSMTEGVSVSNEQGYILYTNPAEDRMFDYQPGELKGQHVTVQNAYSPEENTARVNDLIRKRQSDGSLAGEWRNKKKDGTTFYTHARITAAELHGSKYWVCVQEDITREKLAQAADLRLAAIVESSDDAIISKDLNGIITSWNRGAAAFG